MEPGVYFSPYQLAAIRNSQYIDHNVLARYEVGHGKGYGGVGGVRIEDDIVITKDGYENMTTVSADRTWVEGVCSGDL